MQLVSKAGAIQRWADDSGRLGAFKRRRPRNGRFTGFIPLLLRWARMNWRTNKLLWLLRRRYRPGWTLE